MHPDYPLTTARLLIRPFELSDFETVAPVHANMDLVRFLYWGPRTPEEVREVLEQRARTTTLEQVGDNLSLAAIHRDTGDLVGEFNLRWISDKNRYGEIGYLIYPGHHGIGYATEGATALLKLGFEFFNLHRIGGRLDSRNAASARILEKLGMRREAHLRQSDYVRGEWCDDVTYAILAHEWRALNAPRSDA